MIDDLITWLKAQLDEDERVAREADAAVAAIEGGSWNNMRSPIWGAIGAHIARHDPARVLAEVEAKRAILGWYETVSDSGAIHVDAWTVVKQCVGALVAVYADRPGYRSEWRHD